MGVITRFFECKNKNCNAENKRWANKKHQQEVQNCETCERPTKAWRARHSGRLFGEFKCDAKRGKRTCGNEWFSGNAYYNKWQECLKCRHRCTPVYLREHDRQDEEEDDVEKGYTKPHPDELCQKCQELKRQRRDPTATCKDRRYKTQEWNDAEESKIIASYISGAEITKMTQHQLARKSPNNEQKKIQEETLNKKKTEKAKKSQAENDKKKAADTKPKTFGNENTNPAKLQKSVSLDNCYWDSDNEEDRENWFYDADEVYLDAPFRLQDYKEKLESGSVKEAPLCQPYRKLYFLHLLQLAAENQSEERKKGARNMFNNLYSLKLQEVANKKKRLAKKEAVSKTAAKAAPKDQTEDNKKKTTSPKKNQKNNQKKDVSKDDYLDSDNEEDGANWFYTADEIYLDAPFRLQDYKEKLQSGSVKRAPLCEPYRKLYLLYSALLEEKSRPKSERSAMKISTANITYQNFYSIKIQEAKEMRTASKNNFDDNKENSKSTKTSKSQQNESSLENKMAALTVSSSQKATRTSTSSRRVLTKLG